MLRLVSGELCVVLQVAVLAGHIHSAQAQPVGGATNAMQYVTAASCEGGKRDILFVPLSGPHDKTGAKSRSML